MTSKEIFTAQLFGGAKKTFDHLVQLVPFYLVFTLGDYWRNRYTGRTMAHYAALVDDVDMLTKVFAESKYVIDSVDSYQNTPLVMQTMQLLWRNFSGCRQTHASRTYSDTLRFT